MFCLFFLFLSDQVQARVGSLTSSHCAASWAVGQPKFMQASLSGNFVSGSAISFTNFPSVYNAEAIYSFTVTITGGSEHAIKVSGYCAFTAVSYINLPLSGGTLTSGGRSSLLYC